MPTTKTNHTDFQHPVGIEEYRKQAHELIDFICDYYKNIEERPVLSTVQPGYLSKLLPTEAPQDPEDFKTILKDVDKYILPGITHWQHPSYFAYFSSNGSFPAMLGDMLSSAVNVIGFNWICSPACTELETIVLDWVAKMLKLPEEFLSKGKGGGIIQGTASEAVLVALLGAKAKAFRAWKKKYEKDPTKATDESLFSSKLVVYVSTETHSCAKKACMIADIPNSRVRLIPVNDDCEMDYQVLKKTIEKDEADGLIPFFVVATVGTTGTTGIDDLSKIGQICKEKDIWMHVDSAFVGCSCICPEFRHYLNGVEYAMSFDFNPHKWLLTNFDCSAMFVKDRTYLYDALSITPQYLRNKASESGLVIDYRDLQIPLGRRFRALKLWFVLRQYGVKGLQAFIRHHIELAKIFEELVKNDSRFELVAKRTSALVCFRLKDQSNEVNEKLMNNVNATGKLFFTHTKLKDKFVLRFAICGTHTKEKHVREGWKVIVEEADKLLKN